MNKCKRFYSLPTFDRIDNDAGVAQLFRARPCQGRGHGLESHYPHHQIGYWGQV